MKNSQLLHLKVTSELRYQNYLRITIGNCLRFLFGNYVIKPSKWDQKVT